MDATSSVGVGAEMARVNGSRNRDDVVGYNLANLEGVALDLGTGYDVVKLGIKSSGATKAVLAFDGLNVGDGSGGEDGPAVMVQGQNAETEYAGPVGRFDDEGISFLSDTTFGFEIHDGLAGLDFGRLYQVARLGTSGNDLYDENGSTLATYINGGRGNDQITGGIGNDHLVGGAGADRLDGDAGNDILIGGLSRDTITGGDGDDLVVATPFTDGADSVDLGSGEDAVFFQNDGSGSNIVALHFDARASGDGDANLDGSLAIEVYALDNDGTRISPISHYDDEGTTFTASENTYITIYDGNPNYIGAAVDIAVFGSTADETFDFDGEYRSVYLAGGDGDDVLVGGYGFGVLIGGHGSDRLESSNGSVMYGGEGADTFVFSGAPTFGNMPDFETGIDRIDLSAFGITFANVNVSENGDDGIVDVDWNADGSVDFSLYTDTIPVKSDFVF
jgi:Ca2+-binding RTX toxin-like protein